jgi:hypothetical protein
MVFPELLRGVLAGDALEDLGAAGVFVDEAWGVRVSMPMPISMVGRVRGGDGREEGEEEKEGNTSYVVDVLVDDDV